eukprot:TRINITY_DN2468_c0_g1_i1.p1 TRINITY_DN2468_c0_g1~~TRINITY_DN2468_c0_g1_i1.p1  ORF type:complete len:115 (+),score=4.95 TRINITY_DN2468_c0_g1_i1:35-346(+)
MNSLGRVVFSRATAPLRPGAGVLMRGDAGHAQGATKAADGIAARWSKESMPWKIPMMIGVGGFAILWMLRLAADDSVEDYRKWADLEVKERREKSGAEAPCVP